MLQLNDPEAVSQTLNDTRVDLDLRALVGQRAWDLCVCRGLTLGAEVMLTVVEGGDTADVINAAVGFPLTGEGAEDPTYLWIEDHGLWFEIAFDRDGSPPAFIFVENGPATELGIHTLCLAHFWPGA